MNTFTQIPIVLENILERKLTINVLEDNFMTFFTIIARSISQLEAYYFLSYTDVFNFHIMKQIDQSIDKFLKNYANEYKFKSADFLALPVIGPIISLLCYMRKKQK